MIGWFANAIMAGCDHQTWKIDAERKPVPASERLPGPEDCDADGECWWFDPVGTDGAWYVDTYQGNYTYWLPHWALPVPISEEAP